MTKIKKSKIYVNTFAIHKACTPYVQHTVQVSTQYTSNQDAGLLV